MKKYAWFFLFIGILISGCDKKEDEVINDIETKDDDSTDDESDDMEDTKSVADYPVQDFMWNAMNAFYFWQEDVGDLADTRFTKESDYANFLSAKSNPADFFYSICNQHINVVGDENAVDRFSWTVENYKDLVNSLAGVSKSNGLEYQLYVFDNNVDIFGVVTYVAKNSDAATKDIKRGDIFIGVDGTRLNRSNYIDLLFGDNDTYTLNMADFENNDITDNNKEVTLTKVENFSENPILISKVLEQNGVKIGYLMYNQFLADFDEELNTAFGEFKSANVNELVLDFRYNGGGRVSSAVQIASSVYGTNTTDLFLKARYNSKIQATFDPGDGETNFRSTTLDGSMINALNLSRVYVLTTRRTASASELVINGLEPYINVVQVGGTTTGKNEFSITFVDDVENSYFYDPERESKINPDNQWGIQPLLGRNENADGFSDYTLGLQPDIALDEDISNLGFLGDPEEPFLKAAINHINGDGAKYAHQPIMALPYFESSAKLKRTNNTAIMDGLIKLNLGSKE